jgi:hypothetical protein
MCKRARVCSTRYAVPQVFRVVPRTADAFELRTLGQNLCMEVASQSTDNDAVVSALICWVV